MANTFVTCDSTVNHKMMGNTLGAESAALVTALDRQWGVRLVLESILFVDSKNASDSPSRLRIL